MLMALLNNKHTVPTLLLMLPVENKSMFGRVKNIFQSEMCFVFVCPVTKKSVESGPKGKGYKIRVQSFLLIKFLSSV